MTENGPLYQVFKIPFIGRDIRDIYDLNVFACVVVRYEVGGIRHMLCAFHHVPILNLCVYVCAHCASHKRMHFPFKCKTEQE